MKALSSTAISLSIRVLLLYAFLVLPVLESTPLYAGIAFKGIEKNISDPEKLESFLEDIRQRALDSGVSNFVPYSLLLIKESRAAANEKEFETAAILADFALKMSPDLPPAYEAKAEVLWAKNRLLVYLPFIGYFQSFFTGLIHIEALPFIVISNSAVIVFSCLLTAGLFVLLVAVRCFGLYFHDARHVINKKVPNSVIMIGLLGLFFAPLIFGFTALWLLPLWLFLLFGYLNKQERLSAIFLFLLLLIVPVVIFSAGLGLKLSHSQEEGLLWKVNFDYWDKHDLVELKALKEKNADDEDVLFSLGLVYKKNGDFEKALKAYTELVDLNPGNYQAFINLGNVYLSMNRWQKAVEAYVQAIKLAPGECAAAHFNLSRAYGQKFLFDESEAEFLKAKKIERKRAEKKFENATEHYNRMVIDEQLSKRRIFERALTYSKDEQTFLDNLWSLFFKPVSFKYGFAAIFVLFAASMILVKKDRFRIAMRCTMCGKSLCRRCQREIPKDMTCTQCLNFYKEQDHFDQSLKLAKISKMKRYQFFYTFIRNVLGFVFPGSALIWKGYPLIGTALLFFSAMLFFKIVILFLFSSPWAFLGLTKLPLIVLLAAVLFICWSASVLTTFKLADKNLKKSLL